MNRKTFPVEVIISLLFPEHAHEYRVPRGKIAEVNDLLFRNIDQRGEKIDKIATERSKPEILKQHEIFVGLTSEEADPKNIDKLRLRFGAGIRLVRAMKNLPLWDLQPRFAKRKLKQIKCKAKKKRREEELRASLGITPEPELNEATG